MLVFKALHSLAPQCLSDMLLSYEPSGHLDQTIQLFPGPPRKLLTLLLAFMLRATGTSSQFMLLHLSELN